MLFKDNYSNFWSAIMFFLQKNMIFFYKHTSIANEMWQA